MIPKDSRSGDLSLHAHPPSPATTFVNPEVEQATPHAAVLVLDDETASLRSRLRHTGLAECDDDPQAPEDDPWLDLP